MAKRQSGGRVERTRQREGGVGGFHTFLFSLWLFCFLLAHF